MGKTSNGALWINKNKTSPFEFFQYFYNRDDKDVEMLLIRLTELSMDRINELLSGDIREAKRVMAYEITKRIHGKEEADNALNLATNMFANNNFNDAPTHKLTGSSLQITDILVETKLCASKGEARRMIEQGGITVNDEKITNFTQTLTDADFSQGFAIVKKGKKQIIKVEK